MYSRHMALAKAFPDNFTYEPHEPTGVSTFASSLLPYNMCVHFHMHKTAQVCLAPADCELIDSFDYLDYLDVSFCISSRHIEKV